MRPCKTSENGYLGKSLKNAILKIAILKIIEKGDMHTYAVMKHIRRSPFFSHMLPSESPWALKNDIYNSVKALEQHGYIKPSGVGAGHILLRARKMYKITPKGRKALKDAMGVRIRAFKELSKILK